MEKGTISLTKKRLYLAILLSVVAGIPIGEYIGSQNQLASDELHIMTFADLGTLVKIQGHTYKITEIQKGFNESSIINDR